jgi:uncharacterized membrane protein YhaH (DUF805 family)
LAAGNLASVLARNHVWLHSQQGESMNWYISVLKKYAVFDGRASRTEFWMFTLFSFIAGIVLGIVDGILHTKGAYGIGALGGLYNLAVLLPSIGVAIRRLHDTGRSGWWLLLLFLPVIGWIALLVFYILESQAGDNAYGPNPHPLTPP